MEKIGGRRFQGHKNLSAEVAEVGKWFGAILIRKFDVSYKPVQIPVRVAWNENYNPRTRLPDLHSPLTAVSKKILA